MKWNETEFWKQRNYIILIIFYIILYFTYWIKLKDENNEREQTNNQLKNCIHKQTISFEIK